MNDKTNVASKVKAQAKSRGVQKLRFFAQLGSLLLNVWIGIQFYLWVGHLESGGQGLAIPRPAGVEGWLPIGSLVSVKHFFSTGIINDIHPAGLIIFFMIVLTVFVFRKAFCSWVCPIGFISEMLGDISDKLFGKRIIPPKWLDWPLRSLKYLLLLFFVWVIVIQMTPAAIEAFLYSDYNVVSDILMLHFFTQITLFSLIVIAFLFAMSLIIRGFWCRYFCPYGALLGIFGLFSLTRIKRNEGNCIDCIACTRACPAFIEPKKVKQIWSDECTGCMACVDSCPVRNTLSIAAVSKSRLSTRQWAVAVLFVFWGALLGAKMFGPWENTIPKERYIELMTGVEKGQISHPGADGK
jgi:polyferredoxin